MDRYEITDIGTIAKGIDGSDQYLLIRDRQQEIDQDDVHSTLMPRYYRESSAPGGYFCTSLRIIPDDLHEDRCIVIVQHRYDV